MEKKRSKWVAWIFILGALVLALFLRQGPVRNSDRKEVKIPDGEAFLKANEKAVEEIESVRKGPTRVEQTTIESKTINDLREEYERL